LGTTKRSVVVYIGPQGTIKEKANRKKTGRRHGKNRLCRQVVNENNSAPSDGVLGAKREKKKPKRKNTPRSPQVAQGRESLGKKPGRGTPKNAGYVRTQGGKSTQGKGQKDSGIRER